MKTLTQMIRITLIVLTFLLAIPAFPGGVALATNLYAPPADILQGSPFKDFVIPGLALFVLVGGGGLTAAILLLKKSRFALLGAATAGIMIMFFEFVEVMIIGTEPDYARYMQIFYFALGTLIVALAMGGWFVEILKAPRK